ncbi:MAG: tetratricopeptide repeat protein, partial [Cyanobacteria bacterium P01_C01_bin.72]
MIQEAKFNNIEHKILQAIELKAKQDFDSVCNIYQELVVMQPSNASFYDELAQSQARLGLFLEAIENYQKSIDLGNSNQFWIYKNLGDSLAEVEKVDEAVLAYQKALEIEPERGMVRQKLTKLQSQQPEANLG